METWLIVGAVLIAIAVGIVMVFAAFADRRRAREIEHDPQRPAQSRVGRWRRAKGR